MADKVSEVLNYEGILNEVPVEDMCAIYNALNPLEKQVVETEAMSMLSDEDDCLAMGMDFQNLRKTEQYLAKARYIGCLKLQEGLIEVKPKPESKGLLGKLYSLIKN